MVLCLQCKIHLFSPTREDKVVPALVLGQVSFPTALWCHLTQPISHKRMGCPAGSLTPTHLPALAPPSLESSLYRQQCLHWPICIQCLHWSLWSKCAELLLVLQVLLILTLHFFCQIETVTEGILVPDFNRHTTEVSSWNVIKIIGFWQIPCSSQRVPSHLAMPRGLFSSTRNKYWIHRITSL